MKKQLLTLVATMTLASCVSIALQQPGPARIGSLQVSPQDSWNVLPGAMTPFARKGSQV